VSIPKGETPLHSACCWENVTNLDFVELLLEAGADVNVQDYLGLIPLVGTTPDAPGAAKFLLNWPTTDANITTQSGASFLASIRSTIAGFSVKLHALITSTRSSTNSGSSSGVASKRC
jgi:hypothetical protein